MALGSICITRNFMCLSGVGTTDHMSKLHPPFLQIAPLIQSVTLSGQAQPRYRMGAVCVENSRYLEPKAWPTSEQGGLSEGESHWPCRFFVLWRGIWLGEAILGASLTQVQILRT